MGTSLTAPGRLGLQLALGAALLVLSSALFALLAHDLSAGQRGLAADFAVAQWLHQRATPPLTAIVLVFTHLHSAGAMAAYGLVAAATLAWRRQWRPAWLVTLALGGVLIVNMLMKLAFQRARPTFDEPLLTLATYSFPSGHVAASTVAYGLVVMAVFSATRSSQTRAVTLLGAVAAVVAVAFTRLYLGVHYLSDVLAAGAEGVAWLTICVAALDADGRRRRRRQATDGLEAPEPTRRARA